MQDAPNIQELIKAVRSFLEEKAMPELKGHTAFHARVAANALAIVEREMELGPAVETDERQRLMTLLKFDGSTEEMNVKLAELIRSGDMDLETPGLKDHLWQTTKDKLAIDQPKYSGLRNVLDEED